MGNWKSNKPMHSSKVDRWSLLYLHDIKTSTLTICCTPNLATTNMARKPSFNIFMSQPVLCMISIPSPPSFAHLSVQVPHYLHSLNHTSSLDRPNGAARHFLRPHLNSNHSSLLSSVRTCICLFDPVLSFSSLSSFPPTTPAHPSPLPHVRNAPLPDE